MLNQRLAGLYLHKSINDPKAAAKHLSIIDAEQNKDNRYSIRLAKLYEQIGDLPSAVASATRATEINPYDPDARETLARVLEESGQTDAASVHRERAEIIRKLAAKKPKSKTPQRVSPKPDSRSGIASGQIWKSQAASGFFRRSRYLSFGGSAIT